MMKYSSLLCGLFIALSSCSCKPTASPPQGQDQPPVAAVPSEAFKTWFRGLSTTPQQGVVSKTAVKIKAPSWLGGLKLPGGKKSVVVNASNEGTTFGGGGLNGALHAYVTTVERQTAWKNLRLPDKTTMTAGQQVPAGAYAISDTNFGEIYHAVGPRARDTTDLKEAQGKVQTLYYTMLVKAQQDAMTHIVLPAISTAIFAGAGPGFTQAQFIAAMYEGMYQGIQEFVTKNSAPTLHIILNGWKPGV